MLIFCMDLSIPRRCRLWICRQRKVREHKSHTQSIRMTLHWESSLSTHLARFRSPSILAKGQDIQSVFVLDSFLHSGLHLDFRCYPEASLLFLGRLAPSEGISLPPLMTLRFHPYHMTRLSSNTTEINWRHLNYFNNELPRQLRMLIVELAWQLLLILRWKADVTNVSHFSQSPQRCSLGH